MHNTPWTSALSALGVALLVTSCAGDASAVDDEPAPSTSETAEALEGVIEELDDDFEDWEDTSELVSEQHLADGVEMPEGCLGEPIYVEQGTILDESDLADLCPSEPAADRVFRPSQQILGAEGGVEFIYLPGEDGAGVEIHHLHCEDPDALAEKAAHNAGDQPTGWPQEWDGSGDMPDPYCHPDYLEVGEWENLESHSACWEGIETSTLGDDGQPQAEIDKFLWEQSRARADWQPNPPGGTCAEQWAELDGGDPADYAEYGNADDG